MSYIIDQNLNLIVDGVNVTAGLTGVKLTIAAKAEANALAAEVMARETAIANVIENTDPAALDSLKEVVDAFGAADANLNGAITTLAGSVNSRIDTVESAASTLSSAVAAEVTRAQQAESSLSGQIGSNVSAVASLSTAVGTRFDTVEAAAVTLEARVTAVEGVNESQDTAIAAIANAIAGLVPQGSSQSSHQA